MKHKSPILLALVMVLSLVATSARAEVVLQYFQMSWRDLTQKMPELAEAGYSALWLPPPTKGSGGMSVGYDLWDPFDLGGRDQRGTVRTRYGTEEDLKEMVRTAHRFGIRVYFDNIMNHRAFDIPGYDQGTPIGVYPGMRPEDFHLRVTEDGFYRKWDNTRDWNDEWQVIHLGLSDLIDIAHETGAGGWNHNFGAREGDHHPGVRFVRHPDHPEFYCDHPTLGYRGFNSPEITKELIAANTAFYEEDVNAYLIRAARWKMAVTKADGLRLDAVKHVPSYFFGQQSGGDKNASNAGYMGGVQQQFNLSRGYSDWDNHRNGVFDTEIPRDDAMAFGEHLGQPPAFQPYIDAGMRLKDAPLRDQLNNILGEPWSTLTGLDQPGFSGNMAFNQNTGIMFAHSHDSDYSKRRELQYAYIMTRAGIPIVYTDGYFKAGTLQDSGGAFPRHANTAFLGQFGDPKLPNLAYIHEHFARDTQVARWGDTDVVAYTREDRRGEGWSRNNSMSASDATVMLFMMNDNYASGVPKPISTGFASVSGGDNSYLYNYSNFNGGFYVWASDIAAGNVIIPPGGYFAFSYRTPEASALWAGRPLSVYQNGQEPEWVRVTRRDGPNGDTQFNPRGYANRGYPAGETPEPYRYQELVPRITVATNLTFVARVDGSAKDVLMKLNGGVDLNAHMGIGNQTDTGRRDRPPAMATDTFLGWEDTEFVQRINAEKFGAVETARNRAGSAGAETYVFTAGAAGISVNQNTGGQNPQGTRIATFVYHDPSASTDDPANLPQFTPAPLDASGLPVTLQIKTGHQYQINRVFVYYTVDGLTWPEGAGGKGVGTTRVVSADWRVTVSNAPNNNDWWQAVIPAQPAGTVIRYKVSAVHRQENGTWDVPFPNHPDDVARKGVMMGEWRIRDFNATTISHFPHNDWRTDEMVAGLPEGMNFIQARAFLERPGRAPLFNTFKQSFYLDLQRPTGEIKFPAENDSLPSQEYGVVVRTDSSVTEVWYNILDGDANNDDGTTGLPNGNGTSQWVLATEVTPSLQIQSTHPREWRLTYRNIPSAGTAQIRVRLRELTSAEDFNLSDEAGHFTTLVRTVNTRGPEQKLFIAWPQQDGVTVGQGYVLKAYFSKSLADGTNLEQLIGRFNIRINNTAQGKATFGISYNETGEYHALTFPLPQLYNGEPDYLHQIEVVHTTATDVQLRAFRQVKAVPTDGAAKLAITDPEQFDSDGKQTVIVMRDMPAPSPEDRTYLIKVSTDLTVQNVWIEFVENRGSAALQGAPVVNGSQQIWTFAWVVSQPGTYVFTAYGNTTDATPNHRDVEDFRSIPVIFRQRVEENDADSDDDGIPDASEIAQTPLPEGNSEAWTNGDVHVWMMTGRTNPLMPETDGGGLPDGLQAGLSGPILPAVTSLTADTNGDGFKNFIADRDPPIFNTTDNAGHPRYNFNRSRTDQLGGSMTDPAIPDTDNDGMRDADEDLSRNGRVDIGLVDGNQVVTKVLRSWRVDGTDYVPTYYNSSAVDRLALPANARFLETDPNHSDTDGDGIPDGQEDTNGNGRLDMALMASDGTITPFDIRTQAHLLLGMDATSLANLTAMGESGISSRAVNYAALFAAYARPVRDPGTGIWSGTSTWPRILLLETDPLTADTDGDGLPDGWKTRYGLDPLDNGWYNLRTGVVHAENSEQGPDGDITGDGYTNWNHFLNGTDPRIPITGTPPPADRIVVGPGPSIGMINGVARKEDFQDWRWSDLRALDAYHGGGGNHQSGDIYPAWDGWDSSRDLVAFYFRDGGAPAQGGDGRLHFRLDVHDLKAFAEQGNVDYYVAMNFGDTIGERVLPDEVDTLTQMRWRAVAAVYESALGTVYVDTDSGNNSNNFSDNLAAKGVVSRPGDFLGAYFNSELDAVEFSIARQALLDAGWTGANPADLRFQVYATKSGTKNSPQGAGDIGGRSDIRDSVYNDSIAESHWSAQAGLRGEGSVLNSWIPGNQGAGRVKVALVLHGNATLQPGQSLQNLINNGQGAGYFRPLDPHEVYGVPLNLHITPLLASAIQWAAVDPAAGQPWRDGPAFNRRISSLIGEGVVQLMGTTFSDHILPYFNNAFNAHNVQLARRVLEGIYDTDLSGLRVFYPPERVLDADVFSKIQALGFQYTLADQMVHLYKWLGRETTLGQDGYRINTMHNVHTFALNDQASASRFNALDSGAAMALRRQLNRMARSGTQDQVLVIVSNWDDFLNNANADAYDALIRWMANRPWIEIVTLEDIAADRVDLSGDGTGDPYVRIARGNPPGAAIKVAQEFIQYSSRENYDNWYVGESGKREGLLNKQYAGRAYGMQTTANGLIHDAWSAVAALQHPDVRDLAGAVLHASTFVTAFHDLPPLDLSKYSDGSYINPDNGYRALAGFAARVHSQTRRASLYARVDQWAMNPPATTQAVAADVDLDGEDEYLLYNGRVFALMERMGGRMTAAWVREPSKNRVFQVVGNFASIPEGEGEEEGDVNLSALRASALKDWWAGTQAYVNMPYTFAPTAGGWAATSQDGKIAKTVTLGDSASAFSAAYAVDPTLNGGTLFVRNGLSPDLAGLFVAGQDGLSAESNAGGAVTLSNIRPREMDVVTRLVHGTGGHNATYNPAASDVPSGETYSTLPRRNLALTHQTELSGTGNFSFALEFGTVVNPLYDTDGDGLPDIFEEEHYGSPVAANPAALADNGINTVREAYITGINPRDPAARFRVLLPPVSPWDHRLRIPTVQGRTYRVWYANHTILLPEWHLAEVFAGDGTVRDWVDDGTHTDPHPNTPSLRLRYYRVDVSLDD